MGWRWLTQNGAARVVVVFGGWGFGAAPFAGMTGDADVLFSDDLADLPPALPDLGARRVDAVGWSFGVATMGHWCAANDADFTTRTAICGSLTPVDRRTGIPPRVFALTRDSLTPASFARFARRCVDEPADLPGVDVDRLREDLNAVQSRGAAPDPGFDRAWVATRDAIFPPANLARAWAACDVQQVDAPHMPFGALNSWDKVLP
ncbi:hypothetical protein ACMU_00905 [Actibacterium mucosum KCTC 23349]|uniref:Uncharacterized protein n=1 Tax=Actibacterium mucosum KCTC 23349 TaxID=1454373 RepID=A0A037ZQF6_9RHOB|nr:pimeloyl-ACP methyl esterase BioG family protein [Actibacterium mucosum]KAJ57082.1 hypothetical protein ACMU_00905 [Actibacterium mucosum KCTC 23349]